MLLDVLLNPLAVDKLPSQAAKTFLAVVLTLVSWNVAAEDPSSEPSSFEQLEQRLSDIDEEMVGRLGVYIKDLKDGREITHRLGRDWYLASTIKIPLAIAVLQDVEAGKYSLTQEFELAESDFVDGSGELLHTEPGTVFTLDELIQRSTEHSDSTATDMLIRLLGEEAFNDHLKDSIADEGFNPITTIVGVRHHAYSEIHEDARQLSNLDFIELRAAGAVENRYDLLLEKLDITREQAKLADVNQAFERYYEGGLNSGDLAAMGLVLERLVTGEYLNKENTERLLGYMRNVNTGDGRIKAGLPGDAVFAHKTGTQIDRACNVGILNANKPDQAVVVAVCAESFGILSNAENAFAKVGRAVTDAELVR